MLSPLSPPRTGGVPQKKINEFQSICIQSINSIHSIRFQSISIEFLTLSWSRLSDFDMALRDDESRQALLCIVWFSRVFSLPGRRLSSNV